jgi:hypothetical protein
VPFKTVTADGRPETREHTRERRVFPRFAAQFAASVEAVNEVPLARPAHGCIQDISVGGFALVMEHDIPDGARMQVSFLFPGDLSATVVEVEVVALTRWVTREFVARCRFLSFPTDARSKLDAWISLVTSTVADGEVIDRARPTAD